MDKMSMAASLEGRVPFLDHRLVELAARVPARLKVRGLETKYLLKELARSHLPARIVDRRKEGFAVPVSAWLRPGGPLADHLALLDEPRSRERGFFDRAEVARLVAQHRGGERDHGEILWGLVNLELWQRTMVDASVVP
jgi:asparagine synthase (glutamine-hydrolysing)